MGTVLAGSEEDFLVLRPHEPPNQPCGSILHRGNMEKVFKCEFQYYLD